jgi:predicted TIM-barrel fold metal-dependent hydrolase
MAAVPLQDIDLAVAEAEHAVNKLGLKGVWVRPSPYVDEKPLSNRVYDRFWAACQDLDIPVAFHPAVHSDTPGACKKLGLVHDHPSLNYTNSGIDEDHGGSGLGQAIGNTVDMIVTMGRLVMGGVCERFPRLDFVFLESGGGWCATQLERMDEQVEQFPLEARRLSLRPSEYFKRQCYISFDPGEWNLAASAEFIGPDRIIWASDYPHPEYEPEHVHEMQHRLSALPEEAQLQVLGRNAVRAYRLPL